MKDLVNYVFSGSGAMFPAQLGAYKACEEMYNPKAFCGTSGGAIIASLLAKGLSSDRVISKILDINISDYIDNNYFEIINILEGKDLGFIKGIKIHNLLKILIPEKFNELEFPLTIVTTDINKRKSFIFSDKETPDDYVADAVRASLSIPGIFCPFIYKDKVLIDGGISENFYLDCFKSLPEKIIGIKVNETHDFDKITDLKSLLIQSLYTSIIQNENRNILNQTNALVIKLTVNCNVFDFKSMDKFNLQLLISSGYKETKELL